MATNDTSYIRQSLGLRLLGHGVSLIFHPLFVTVYIAAFLLYLHPVAFAGASPISKVAVLLSLFINTVFIPAFSVFVMRRLKLIGSIYLPTQKDRIIPLVAIMIFYFWAWYVSINRAGVPVILQQLLFGSFIAICLIWLCTIRFKISMHAVGAGGLAMFFLILSLTDDYPNGLFISGAFFFAGLILTARRIVSDHSAGELYAGLAAGAASQLFSWYWYFGK